MVQPLSPAPSTPSWRVRVRVRARARARVRIRPRARVSVRVRARVGARDRVRVRAWVRAWVRVSTNYLEADLSEVVRVARERPQPTLCRCPAGEGP